MGLQLGIDLALPGTCFVSHAYADDAACDWLIDMLPPDVRPVLFPPIVAEPHEFVSNALIRSILECDGLIYLQDQVSDRSFWVAFERDYALRSGKPVFAAKFSTSEIVRDSGPPLDLATYASYRPDDRAQVEKIATFLQRERHFDIWLADERLASGENWEDTMRRSLSERLGRGYVIVFWSWGASESSWVRSELESAAAEMPAFNDRVLFALLDDCALPEFWLRFAEPSVQLFGDSAGSSERRLDDLVVRLYWLIYRKSKRLALS